MDIISSKLKLKVDETLITPHKLEDYITSNYPHREKRKVFFIASSGICHLMCPYCITGRPKLPSSLTKNDFSFIFNHFGENIYFIISGVGDFFCGYSEKEQLLSFLLQHDIRILLDINGVEIRELGNSDLNGKEKIDMIDISYHFGTMKKQGMLRKWGNSIRKIHENGYDYHIKMVLSPLERDLWDEGILFYKQEVFPFTARKLLLSPDYMSDINNQQDELARIAVENKETVESLSRYGLFNQTNFPAGKNPPCPAGNRYFRVLHSGEIMPCEYLANNLNIRLGNIKEKNVTSLKNDVLCNYAGFCDCGWTALPRFGLLNWQYKLYERRFFFKFESSAQNAFMKLPKETNNITFKFSKVGYDIPILKNIVLEGSAYINDMVNKKNVYYILLQSDNKYYIFDSLPTKTPEANYPEANLTDEPAFFVFIPYDAIEPGEYRVGIYIKNDTAEALQYTNEIVHKD